MNNFEKFISELTLEQFCDMMILNCDGCPAYPCKSGVMFGSECYDELMKWCKADE